MEPDIPFWKGTDQCGRTVVVKSEPARIVSLVPSLSYLLHYLGLNDRVVGITRFCVHPESWKQEKILVGGTKRIDPSRIVALAPDLVIANREENEKELVDKLEAEGIPVWVSDVYNLDSALDMIRLLGVITGTGKTAQALIEDISGRFGAMDEGILGSCLYLIWKNPWMAAGGDTFIGDMLRKAGFLNVLERSTRYPALSADEIAALRPEFILLSSEPFPFGTAEEEYWKRRLPEVRVLLVDGEMFSWYGPSMRQFSAYVQELRNSMTENR